MIAVFEHDYGCRKPNLKELCNGDSKYITFYNTRLEFIKDLNDRAYDYDDEELYMVENGVLYAVKQANVFTFEMVK